MRGKATFSSIIILMFFCVSILLAQYEKGDWVELKASKPAGVPVHLEIGAPYKGERASDGSVAQIIDLAQEGHWLKIKLNDGRERWIVERYVMGEVLAPTPVEPDDDSTQPASDDDWLVWGAGQSCIGVIDDGKRLYPKSDQLIRVGTWNVRWFPDETNLEWLACSITYMNVDILAIQEFRHNQQAKSALNDLLKMLKNKTGGEWKYDLHQCGSETSQHVGFLWNKSRLEVTGHKDMWEFNSRATADSSPCQGSLRPGRYCYVKSKQGGVDFHLISIHTKSSPNVSAQQERYKVLNNFATAAQPLLQKDKDIIVVGDYNTMGNGSSGSAAIEIATLKQICLNQAPGFIQFEVTPSCSEYYKGHGGWLDHILVTQTMSEIPSYMAFVQGYCKVKSCGDIQGNMPAAYSELSDHCPIVFKSPTKTKIIDKGIDLKGHTDSFGMSL